jgi:hypothetical protein
MTKTSEGKDKPRRRSAGIACLVVLIACAALGVSVAHAYDRSTCGTSRSWEEVDQFRMSAGIPDLGDDLHLGGAPQGTAVACWDGNLANATATTVFVKAKLYRDSTTIGPGAESDACAIARFLFSDGANGLRATRTRTVCGEAGLRSGIVELVVSAPVHKIRIELLRHHVCCEQPQLQQARNVVFGS